MRRTHRPPYAHDARLETRYRELRHLGQLVRGLKSVEQGRQAEIEDVVEDEDGDAHGNNDNKDGVLAHGQMDGASPTFGVRSSTNQTSLS